MFSIFNFFLSFFLFHHHVLLHSCHRRTSFAKMVIQYKPQLRIPQEPQQTTSNSKRQSKMAICYMSCLSFSSWHQLSVALTCPSSLPTWRLPSRGSSLATSAFQNLSTSIIKDLVLPQFFVFRSQLLIFIVSSIYSFVTYPFNFKQIMRSG